MGVDNPSNSDAQSDTNLDLDRKARQVELVISALLRVGVVASLLVIVAGTAVTFIHHPEYIHSRTDLSRLTSPGAARFPTSLSEVIRGVGRGEGRAIVLAGLLLLIATPVMRVAISIFAFVYERERVFVILTSVVLALLLFSFVLGKATG